MFENSIGVAIFWESGRDFIHFLLILIKLLYPRKDYSKYMKTNILLNHDEKHNKIAFNYD